MEFFAIADVRTTEEELRYRLKIESLSDWCGSISGIRSDDEIDSVWGVFRVHREEIRGGVRFTLPTCPNAFAWTVTTGFPPAEDKVVIHCTINRRDHDPDFIESIEDFADDWKTGLEAGLTGP